MRLLSGEEEEGVKEETTLATEETEYKKQKVLEPVEHCDLLDVVKALINNAPAKQAVFNQCTVYQSENGNVETSAKKNDGK